MRFRCIGTRERAGRSTVVRQPDFDNQNSLNLTPLLRWSAFLDAGDYLRRFHANCIANSKEHIDGWRLLVVLKLADVSSINLSLES